MREHALHIRHDNALSRLLEGWQNRDDRYAEGRERMSAAVEAQVREARRNEIDRLPFGDRATAIFVLSHWSPPRPQRMLQPFLPAIRVHPNGQPSGRSVSQRTQRHP